MIITKTFRPEDRARLHELNEACYSGIQRPSPTEFNEMLKCKVFTAFEGSVDKVIGFAIVRENAGGGYLWSLAVDPEFQGRGVGGNLLREVIKYYTLAKGTELDLHVHPSNPAQKLYYDYGFRVTSVARHWYGVDGDGLFMWRALP